MPSRILKESICTSNTVDLLTAEEERFFYRLMVKCDDFGRFHAHPGIVRGSCFPRKDGMSLVQVGDLLDALEHVGLICRYLGDDGERYLQMVTWDKHQQVRAKASKFPGPPADGTPPPADDGEREHLLAHDSGREHLQAIEINGSQAPAAASTREHLKSIEIDCEHLKSIDINCLQAPADDIACKQMSPYSYSYSYSYSYPETTNESGDEPGATSRAGARVEAQARAHEPTPIRPIRIAGEPVPKPRPRTSLVDDAFKERMVTKWQDTFGSADVVQEIMAEAMGHKALSKSNDQCAYLNGWLRRESTHYDRRPHGNARSHGAPMNSRYRGDEAERAELRRGGTAFMPDGTVARA